LNEIAFLSGEMLIPLYLIITIGQKIMLHENSSPSVLSGPAKYNGSGTDFLEKVFSNFRSE
jgi:hypothetical protein